MENTQQNTQNTIPFNGNLVDALDSLKMAFLKDVAEKVTLVMGGSWEITRERVPSLNFTFENQTTAWYGLELRDAGFLLHAYTSNGHLIESTTVYTARDTAVYIIFRANK